MSERNKSIVLIGVIAMVLLIILAFGYALVAGRNLADFSPTLLGFAIPVITTLLAAVGISKELGEVHTKVNGNYETLTQQNVALQTQINQLLAITPPEKAEAITTEMPAVRATFHPPIEGRHRA